MEESKFRLASRWMKRITITTVVVSFIPAIGTFYVQGFTAPMFTNHGFTNLFDSYGVTFTILGFAAFLFTLWLTLERMEQTERRLTTSEKLYKQTQKQIDVMSDNNKFNNFFKHREEFLKYFIQKKYIKSIAIDADTSPEGMLIQFYDFFFYKSYNDFKPSINDDVLARTYKFIEHIGSSELNKKEKDFCEINNDEIEKLFKILDFRSPSISLYINKKINLKNPYSKDLNGNLIQPQKDKFGKISMIYFTYYISKDILLFSSDYEEKVSLENFADNYEKYRYTLGIDIDASFFFNQWVQANK